MNETTTASVLTQFEPHKPRDRRLQLGLQFARLMRAGKLHLLLPDGSAHDFEGSEPGPSATLIVKDARMVGKLAFGGCLGLAEAYLEGMWDSPHVTDVLALGTANEQAWENMLRGKAWARFASWLMHKLRPNSRKGSRKNIAEHYDLGNDFYAEWLDRSMTYSSALFEGGVSDLEAAQAQKYRRLCESLELKPGMSVLEIGCGWGGFAEMAAGEFGATVTGVTLSTEQLAYARDRIAKAGLSDKVTPAGAGWPRQPAGHHHRRQVFRRLPQDGRLHPALRLSWRHASLSSPPARGNRQCRPGPWRTALVWQRLRRDAEPLACGVPGEMGQNRGALGAI